MRKSKKIVCITNARIDEHLLLTMSVQGERLLMEVVDEQPVCVTHLVKHFRHETHYYKTCTELLSSDQQNIVKLRALNWKLPDEMTLTRSEMSNLDSLIRQHFLIYAYLHTIQIGIMFLLFHAAISIYYYNICMFDSSCEILQSENFRKTASFSKS